jgi:hypothetical protein
MRLPLPQAGRIVIGTKEHASMKLTLARLLTVVALLPLAPTAWAQAAPGAAPPPGTAAYKCPRELCEIKVDASACKTGGVRVDRPLVEAHDVTLLRWSITPPGQGFDTPAVRVDAPDGEFEVRPSATPDELRMFNRNSIMGEFLYPYTLHVRGCPPLQAWVRNVAI